MQPNPTRPLVAAVFLAVGLPNAVAAQTAGDSVTEVLDPTKPPAFITESEAPQAPDVDPSKAVDEPEETTDSGRMSVQHYSATDHAWQRHALVDGRVRREGASMDTGGLVESISFTSLSIKVDGETTTRPVAEAAVERKNAHQWTKETE